MPLPFHLKSVSGCDFDSDELYISPNHGTFIKNMCLDLALNQSTDVGASGKEGSNSGVYTPIESNELLCPIPLPDGFNYCVGYHESKEINKGFVFVYNSFLNHVLYSIDGLTGQCTVVKRGSCLGLSLNPRHFVSEGRCVLIPFCFFNKEKNIEERKEYLIYTLNKGPVKFISVTDAVETNGFTGPFFSDNCDECELMNLGVPTPSSCIDIKPVERPVGDTKDNLLADKAWQFRVKFIDVWGRESEHGIISTLWYSSVGNCIKQTAGQPRCVELSFDAGCATVTQIQIEFRTWQSNLQDELVLPSDWYIHETIYKYSQDDPRKPWFQRDINPEIKLDKASNRMAYKFCGDKSTSIIPKKR